MTRCFVTAAAFIILSIGSVLAHSGQIVVSASAYRPTPAAANLGTVAIDTYSLKATAKSATAWSFDFSDPSDIFGHISLKISDPPHGWMPFHLDMDVPFYWTDIDRIPLAATIVDDENNNTSVAKFLRRAVGVHASKNIADYIEVNQRAKKLFSMRVLARPDNPSEPVKRDDIRIAYWLIFTSSFLITERFASVDTVTKSARDFLYEQGRLGSSSPSTDGESARLFGASTVTIDEVKDVVTVIDNRDAILYNKIAHELSIRIERPQSPDLLGSCPRAYRLAEQYATMSSDDLALFTKNFANQIIAYRLAVVCRSAAIQANLSRKEVPSEADIQAARQAMQLISDLIDNLSEAPPDLISETKQAIVRRDVLKATVESLPAKK